MIFRKLRFVLAGLLLCFSLLTVAHNSHGLGLSLGLSLSLQKTVMPSFWLKNTNSSLLKNTDGQPLENTRK